MIQWLMMGERFRYEFAISTAEVMYALLEALYQRGECNLNALMRRLKDLSAYSLTHAEIMDQREGPELLAVAMFFGATSNPKYHKNQERIRLLSEETFAYQGQSETIEKEVAMRKTKGHRQNKDSGTRSSQPRLF